jgi:hypothetical protein
MVMLRAATGLLIVAGLCVPAVAADLPLKAGVYLEMSASCAQPNEAATIRYFGGVLSASGTVTIKEEVVKHHGSTYFLRDTIKENQSGAVDVLNDTVTIISPTAFKLATKYATGSYRWCGPDLGM